MEKEQTKQKRSPIILIAIILILLIAVIALILPRLIPKKEVSSDRMTYQANVIVDDPESLQDAIDAMIEKAQEGQMALEMKSEAISLDGKNFSCYLANSSSNNYDMFMVLYRDDTQEEIYRTSLIPIGARIEEFTLEDALETGSYEITIVYNQVEEDLKTIHAQVNVGLTLVVK